MVCAAGETEVPARVSLQAQEPRRRWCSGDGRGQSREPADTPPALGALTVRAPVQWDRTAPGAPALPSPAAPAPADPQQLRPLAAPGGTAHAALVMRGHHAPFLAAFRVDGRWHHVRATWEQRAGRWALFADGRVRAGARGLGLGAGQPVPPGGILVLGQDQDSGRWLPGA